MANQELQTTGNGGTLQISAFSPGRGRPAPDTAVNVRNDRGELVFAGITDSSGFLPPFVLPAPPAELSLEPTALKQGDPFSSYDLTAVSALGERTDITGVQIYSGQASRQNIIFPGQSDDIIIPDPGIMGRDPEKIPEPDQKPLPPPENSVVLPQPVIPETVIVHAGVPSDKNAKDYYVGFREYIKNVACSEIYATWGDEAIKANVIAIISFTLNRIYTEWYRGKGYSFTITNSTAYDQAFTYGRNLFSRISDIVDENFTLYITRRGASQPLLAQFCDGIRVNRSGWLSQWGAKELSDKGYDAMRILRYYYGQDIILKEAPKVEGIPVSFQGVLNVGSRGAQVRVIQSQLNGISDNFPLIPKLAVDGIYGEKTAGAVKKFQQIFGMPVTGITDLATWYRISDIYVAVKKLAELD